jgi:hypothetical protein
MERKRGKMRPEWWAGYRAFRKESSERLRYARRLVAQRLAEHEAKNAGAAEPTGSASQAPPPLTEQELRERLDRAPELVAQRLAEYRARKEREAGSNAV